MSRRQFVVAALLLLFVSLPADRLAGQILRRAEHRTILELGGGIGQLRESLDCSGCGPGPHTTGFAFVIRASHVGTKAVAWGGEARATFSGGRHLEALMVTVSGTGAQSVALRTRVGTGIVRQPGICPATQSPPAAGSYNQCGSDLSLGGELTLGLAFKLGRSISIGPEVTYLRTFTGGSRYRALFGELLFRIE